MRSLGFVWAAYAEGHRLESYRECQDILAVFGWISGGPQPAIPSPRGTELWASCSSASRAFASGYWKGPPPMTIALWRGR